MQPNQNPYDFIMNPEKPAGRRPSGGGSPAVKLLVIVGVVFVAILILGLSYRAFSGGGGGGDKEALTGIVQDQVELARLADVGSEDAVDQGVKNFAVNTKLTAVSHQTALTTYLGSIGIEIDEKQLGAKQDTQADARLADAQSASTFDPTYKTIMQQQLVNYQKDLNAAYGGVGDEGKAVLKRQFDAAQLLLTQVEQL